LSSIPPHHEQACGSSPPPTIELRVSPFDTDINLLPVLEQKSLLFAETLKQLRPIGEGDQELEKRLVREELI
jgi:hypothetical protein